MARALLQPWVLAWLPALTAATVGGRGFGAPGCGPAAADDGGLDDAFAGSLNLLQGHAAARPNASAAPARRRLAARSAQAALGADGSPRIRLQARRGAEHGLIELPADGLPGAATAVRARLREENSRLREENARLRAGGAALRAGNAALRLEDVKLRHGDTELRLEDAKLRMALASASGFGPQATTPGGGGTEPASRSTGPPKKTILFGSAFVTVILVLAFIVFHSSECFMGDDPHSSDDEYEEKLLFDLDGHKQRGRYCSCCWCCCSPGVLAFLTFTLVVSVLGGCVLWEMGILQPILAQFMTYAYVILLFAAFVAILVWEFWRMFRAFVKYIVTQVRGLKNLLRPFRRPPRQVDIFAN